MVERFKDWFGQSRGLGGICFMLLLVVTTAPCETSAGGPEWVIDSSMVPGIGMPQGDESATLAAFGMDGADTDTVLTGAVVYRLTHSGWRPRMGNRHLRWWPPGYGKFLLAADGYRPIRLDSLRLAPDSLVVVTATLQPGTDTMSQEIAQECCLTVRYESLDNLISQNSIVGTVTDASLDISVEGAEVYCEELKRLTSTDSLGEFIMRLDTLKSVHLHVWHPLYDSIRFEVGKYYLRTEKKVDVIFEKCRNSGEGRPLYTDTSAVLIVTWLNWGSNLSRPTEFPLRVFTYAVEEGQVFGPTSRWVGGECLPFRLVRTFKDRHAWVQFVEDLGYMGEEPFLTTNLLDVSDVSAKLGTKTVDAGTTISLQLQPNYTPRGIVFKTFAERLADFRRGAVPDKNECDSIRAEVERVHLRNFVSLLTRDFESLATAYSSEFKVRGEGFTPSVQAFGRLMPKERSKELLHYRVPELFDLHRSEAYVHNVCDEPISDRYLTVMGEVGLEFASGDVMIGFKNASQSPYHGSWGAIYRKEDRLWKIITHY